jgi:hypothetical protein
VESSGSRREGGTKEVNTLDACWGTAWGLWEVCFLLVAITRLNRFLLLGVCLCPGGWPRTLRFSSWQLPLSLLPILRFSARRFPSSLFSLRLSNLRVTVHDRTSSNQQHSDLQRACLVARQSYPILSLA